MKRISCETIDKFIVDWILLLFFAVHLATFGRYARFRFWRYAFFAPCLSAKSGASSCHKSRRDWAQDERKAIANAGIIKLSAAKSLGLTIFDSTGIN